MGESWVRCPRCHYSMDLESTPEAALGRWNDFVTDVYRLAMDNPTYHPPTDLQNPLLP